MDSNFMVECKNCHTFIIDRYSRVVFEGFCCEACKSIYERRGGDKARVKQQPAIEKGDLR